MQVVLDDELMRVLKHSLGLTRAASEYRNYYAAEPDDAQCNKLIELGYMHRGIAIPGGLIYFHVTEEGRKRVYGTK